MKFYLSTLELLLLVQVTLCTFGCQEKTNFYSETNCIVFYTKCWYQDKVTFRRCEIETGDGNISQIQQQSLCIRQCCTTQTNNLDSTFTLESCGNQTYSEIYNLKIIFGICLALGVLCIFSICCCYVCFKLYTQSKLKRHNKIFNQQNSLAKINKINQSIQYLTNNELNDLHQCCICLDNNVNCLLGDCLHPFHLACIQQWLSYSHFCPLCHNKQFQQILCICTKCYKSYIPLKWVRNERLPLDQILKMQNFGCNNCEAKCEANCEAICEANYKVNCQQ